MTGLLAKCPVLPSEGAQTDSGVIGLYPSEMIYSGTRPESDSAPSKPSRPDVMQADGPDSRRN